MFEAIYVRQSIDKKDSISIESQIDKCTALAHDEHKIKIYKDKGFSGKDLNRPSFKLLLSDIENGLVSRVIVYKLDRLSRSTLDFSILMQKFKEYKVDFTSISETFDTSTPIGQAMLQIVMVFAELERTNIQLRVKDNYYARGKRGMFLGGPPPYGYERVREKGADGKEFTNLITNYQEAIILREIFTNYAQNTMTTLADVCKTLNNDMKKWDTSQLGKLMRNPIYVKADANVYTYLKSKGYNLTNDITDYAGELGCYLYGNRNSNDRKYQENEQMYISLSQAHGLIDAEVWLACQTKLDQNTQVTNSARGTHSWLSGLIKCGKCGYAITVTKSRQNKYFVCRGKHNFKGCTGQTITQYTDEIEDYIATEITKKLKTLPETEVNYNSDFIKNNEIATVIFKIDEQIKNLTTALTMLTGASIEIIDKELNELATKKRKLLSQIESNQNLTKLKAPKDALLQKAWCDLTFKERKFIAGLLISRVYLDDTNILIEWRV